MKAPVRFQLSDKPVLEVGGLEDDLTKEFDQRQGYLRGVMLSNGELAVIDVNRVHLFDRDGKRKVITGRDGSGPGEFRYVTAICRTRGDTIVVSDDRNRRITVLDRNAAVVRTIPEVDGSSLPFDGCLTDGTFILNKIVRLPDANGAIRGALYAVARYRLDGTLVDSVGTFDFGGLDMASGREPQIFAGGQWTGFASGRGDIELHGSNPRATMIIRSADQTESISDAQREARLMRTIPNGTSPDEIRQRMDRMRGLSKDKTWPAHRRIHFDDDGRLWVQDFNQEYYAEHGWTAFDPSGRLIGRLMIPTATKRYEVIGFAKDRVIVARKTEDDALHLSVFAIKPVGGK